MKKFNSSPKKNISAFNEWWEKEQMDKRGAYGMQWVGEDIWKAALRWALKQRGKQFDNVEELRYTMLAELRGD